MKLKFVLNEEDYLINQLYVASHSENVRKNRIKTWIAVMAAYLLIGILLYQIEDKFVFNFFAILAVITSVIFPLYLRGHYKRQYKKSVIENYQNRFGSEIIVDFKDSNLEVKNSIGKSQFPYTSIKKMVEITGYFLVKMKNTDTLIIPKNQLSNSDEVKYFLSQLAERMEIQYLKELNWKWK